MKICFCGSDTETMKKSERLRLYPASREQMEAMIASEQDEELKKAYTEMLFLFTKESS